MEASDKFYGDVWSGCLHIAETLTPERTKIEYIMKITAKKPTIIPIIDDCTLEATLEEKWGD
ncbi:MAG: hypothetical protein WED07_03470 [Candidatus Freyarchaeum deiterrae]